jgi:hypothetical protein
MIKIELFFIKTNFFYILIILRMEQFNLSSDESNIIEEAKKLQESAKNCSENIPELIDYFLNQRENREKYENLVKEYSVAQIEKQTNSNFAKYLYEKFDIKLGKKYVIDYLIKNNKVYFELILTFQNKPQEFMYMMFDNNVDEDQFINEILKKIDTDCEDLIKISSCQFYTNVVPWLNFLKPRNGKYYFNDDVNEDDDTKKWANIKRDYFKSLNK